jgi:hypothetical protein
VGLGRMQAREGRLDVLFHYRGAREGGFGVSAFYCGLVWVGKGAVTRGPP